MLLSNIPRQWLLAVFCVLLLIVPIACNSNAASPANSTDKAVDSTDKADNATADSMASNKTDDLRVLGQSPEFLLTDQDGNPFGSDHLRGKPWIVNFMFTSCVATCPRQTAELQKFQAKLKRDGRLSEINLVSITVDPEIDSPEVLTRYAKTSQADITNWKFLTGPKDSIRDAISRKGFMLAVEPNSENARLIAHSPMFILVDASMRIRGLYDSGDVAAVNQMQDDLKRLESENIYIPADIKNPEWLDKRKQEQLDSAETINVPHDFRFTDQRKSSGIDFRHKMVDDAGRNYKGVHYDHGNGVVVADINNDDLMDIYFVNQVGANSLWQNLGDGKFRDITTESGTAAIDRICVSAAFADIDNDGDSDLYVTSVRKGNLLFENLGDGKFRDISRTSGVDHQGHSSGAVFFDFDRDGLLDLFVANVGVYTMEKMMPVTMESIRGESGEFEYPLGFSDGFAGHLKPDRDESSLLFRNIGDNQFEDVTRSVRIDDYGWTGDATPLDINHDGWMDLYLLNMQGDDRCYINREGKHFDVADQNVLPQTPWGSMGIKAFDFENDGDLDIYVTDMHSDMSQEVDPGSENQKSVINWPDSFLQTTGSSIFGNAFFRNDGEGSFEDFSDELNAENYWPWGLSVDDLNADGFDDAFIASSMNFPFRYSTNLVLLNENGTGFRNAEFILGIEPRADGSCAPWFELDVYGTDANLPTLETLIRKNLPSVELPARIVVWSALGSRSSAILDLENDGDLDIVTLEMNHYPMILVSDHSEQNPELTWLKVNLTGTKSNRSGLGAAVTVFVDGRKLKKVKDGQSGYMSHSDMPLYFGLAGAQQVTRIEVQWPSGIRQVVNGPIQSNQLLTISEKE